MTRAPPIVWDFDAVTRATVRNSVFSGQKIAVRGTYGIIIGRAVNVTFENCTQVNRLRG